MTPKFLELIDINSIDIDKFKEIRKKYSYILSKKITTLEEYGMFYRFYSNILKEYGYLNYEEISKKVAYNRTYEFDKYKLCDDIINELNYLKNNYILLLLTDNWPCVIPYLKNYNLYDLFNEIYISSIYGVEKKDKVFFDYPIKDYDINPNQTLFIDDNETNLDIASEKKIKVLLMDRNNKVNKSKYKIINSLYEIK